MTRSIKFLASTAVVLAVMSSPVFLQAATQLVALTNVELQALARGSRATNVVGSTVINEGDENVGTVDDLILTHDEKVSFAILSVGGFLGMGTRYVVVPYAALETHDKRMLLRNATKESLRNLPEYKYGN